MFKNFENTPTVMWNLRGGLSWIDTDTGTPRRNKNTIKMRFNP